MTRHFLVKTKLTVQHNLGVILWENKILLKTRSTTAQHALTLQSGHLHEDLCSALFFCALLSKKTAVHWQAQSSAF